MKYQLLIIFFLGLSLAPAGLRPGATDISGNWAFSVNLDGGPQNVPYTIVFKQEGEKLTGTQSGASGEQKITGTVKGNQVVFSVEGKTRSGDPYKNTPTGTIVSPAEKPGMHQTTYGSGTWTRSKK